MDTAGMLKKTPLFTELSDKEISSLLATAKAREFSAGQAIIHEGQEGAQAFYLLLEGTAEVTKGGKHLADLGPGDYFGEMALLIDDQPRTADVTATSGIKVLAITQWDFRALLKVHHDISVKVMAELARRLEADAAESA